MHAGSSIPHLSFSFALLAAGCCLAAQPVLASADATVRATARIAVCGNGVKEHGEQCDISDFSGVDCASAGFEQGGAIACTPACEDDFASCRTAADTVDQDDIPPAASHRHVLANGDGTTFTCEMPAGSSSDGLSALFFSYRNAAMAAQFASPAGLTSMTRTYQVIFLDADGRPVDALPQPFDLSISYAETETNGTDEWTLRPYHYGSDRLWHEIAGATVDVTADTVDFPATQAGYYRLMAIPAVAPAGGGGGSSFTPLQSSRVSVSGYAYPGSPITLLRDGQVVDRGAAGGDGFFSMTSGGLTGGTYVFGVYAQDALGSYSSLRSFSMTVAPRSSYAMKDVDPAPTLSVTPTETERGGSILLSGYAQPGARITFLSSADARNMPATEADAAGKYVFRLDTSDLPAGAITLRAQATYEGTITPAGEPAVLTVAPPSQAPSSAVRLPSASPRRPVLHCDLNADGRVDLVDFSIEAYWFGKAAVPKDIDLDGDGRVTLVDFSILASHWTG